MLISEQFIDHPVIRRVGQPYTEAEDVQIVRWAELDVPRAEIARRLGREVNGVFKRIRLLMGRGMSIKASTPNAPRPKQAATYARRMQKSGWRDCMCCKKRFMSEGAHNRLCVTCRGKSTDCFSRPVRINR